MTWKRLFTGATRDAQQHIRELYRSANGEPLVPHPDDGKAQVLHEPNAASGGRPSRLEVGDFLARGAHGPQHAELLRLIGTLASKGDWDGIVEPQPLRVVLDGGNFKALVEGEVAECVAATGENVHVMLDDIGFAMVR